MKIRLYATPDTGEHIPKQIGEAFTADFLGKPERFVVTEFDWNPDGFWCEPVNDDILGDERERDYTQATSRTEDVYASLGEDALIDIPDEWYEHPLCRIAFATDSGDPSVGIPGRVVVGTRSRPKRYRHRTAHQRNLAVTATRIEINADPKEDEMAVVHFASGRIAVIRNDSITIFESEVEWRDDDETTTWYDDNDGKGI